MVVIIVTLIVLLAGVGIAVLAQRLAAPAQSGASSVTCGPMDADQNGRINAEDLGAFSKVMGLGCTKDDVFEFNSCGSRDANNSSSIDEEDLNALKAKYGQSCS